MQGHRILHIHSANIRYNARNFTNKMPVFNIGYFEQAEYREFQSTKVELWVGDTKVGTFLYDKKSPLKSGAHVWMEIEEGVDLVMDEKETSMADPTCNICKKKHHSVRYSRLFPDEICEAVCNECHRKKLNEIDKSRT